jgi:deoxyadenosine/deoxycytidine kinase
MKIIIEGHCAEGKSTISEFIANALRSAGFGVHNGDFDVQHGSVMPEFLEQCIAGMVAKDTLIDIETVQTKKEKR